MLVQFVVFDLSLLGARGFFIVFVVSLMTIIPITPIGGKSRTPLVAQLLAYVPPIRGDSDNDSHCHHRTIEGMKPAASGLYRPVSWQQANDIGLVAGVNGCRSQ